MASDPYLPLVDGLSQLVSPGSPGPVAPTNATCAVIVGGDADTSVPSVFCLARTNGSGRVVAIGHDGIVNSSLYDDTKFVQNVTAWLNQALPKRVAFSDGHSEWVTLAGSSTYVAAVQAQGFTVSQLSAPLTSNALTSVDVLIVGNAWGDFTASEISAVESFVTQGGGVFLIGLGWSWLAYHPGSTLDDYPMTKMAAPYGMRWRDGSITDPTNQYDGSPIFHVFYPLAVDDTVTNCSGHASAPNIFRYGYDSVLATADLLYAEVRIEKSYPGTYFCSIGGDSFYMGLQEGGIGGYRHVHFSVWDGPIAEAQVAWKAADVTAARFGGEGTGWMTYWPFIWETNVTYRFCIQITHEAGNTLYHAYFYEPVGGWKHLASLLRPVAGAGLNYFYSFNEDFGAHCCVARSFLVGNEWARRWNGQWVDLSAAIFGHSLGQCSTNAFDADVVGQSFRLETGGDTVRDTDPGSVLYRSAGTQPASLPPEVTATNNAGDGIPGWWKVTYGLNPLANIGAEDPDGDSLNNLQEYLAGTDPTNSCSALRIAAIGREGTNVRLTWTCVGGHRYRVQTNVTTNFSNLAPLIMATGVGESVTNYLDVGGATNVPARFYRVALVTTEAASDSAADPAYASGWTTGSNGGTGFGPWTLTGTAPLNGANNGYFLDTSTKNAGGVSPGIDTSGKSWGIYANGGNYTAAFRAFVNPLPIGGTLRIDMDNGWIDTGQTDGFVLRNGNATNDPSAYNTNARFEFLYIGGDSSNSYKVVDAAGLRNVGVPFTGTGLRLLFKLNTADTYTLWVIDNAAGATNAVVTGTLSSSGSVDSIALYNRNAGNGVNFDCFFNSLQIVGP